MYKAKNSQNRISLSLSLAVTFGSMVLLHITSNWAIMNPHVQYTVAFPRLLFFHIFFFGLKTLLFSSNNPSLKGSAQLIPNPTVIKE